MPAAKHLAEAIKIRQLEETIRLKDREIKDVKRSFSNILSLIKELNEGNSYGNTSQRKVRISEICTDTIDELLIDELEYSNEKAKIIELPNTRKSNK